MRLLEVSIYFPAFYFSFGARPAGARYYQIYMLREYKPAGEVAGAGIKKIRLWPGPIQILQARLRTIFCRQERNSIM
jgi:hypothetical protein